MINGLETSKQPKSDDAERLLADARIYAESGRVKEAFQCGARALLMRPGDVGILSFLDRLKMPKNQAGSGAVNGSGQDTVIKSSKPNKPTTPCFTTAAVKDWPMAYCGGHPQRYEYNFPTYLERGGLVRPGIDIRGYTRDHAGKYDDMCRFYFFCHAFDQIVKEGLAGNFAELGVDKGSSATLLATFARRIGTTVYLLDTYEGFSPKDIRGIDAGREIQFADASLEKVRARVGEKSVRFIKGHFPESAAQMPDDLIFSLVHIDCDLYAPALSALEYFYPRMTPGGFIIIHDYNSLFWDGLEKAVDEFFRDKPEAIIPVPDLGGSVVVRKARRLDG